MASSHHALKHGTPEPDRDSIHSGIFLSQIVRLFVGSVHVAPEWPNSNIVASWNDVSSDLLMVYGPSMVSWNHVLPTQVP